MQEIARAQPGALLQRLWRGLGPGLVTGAADDDPSGIATHSQIGAPSRICQALAPLAFGLLIDPMGRGVVAVSAGFSLAALIALMLLPHARPEKAAAAAE